MGRVTSIISSATTLPSSKQLKRGRDSFSALANAFFLFWVWRYVCVEAYRYIRAKGLAGVGKDGAGNVKKVSLQRPLIGPEISLIIEFPWRSSSSPFSSAFPHHAQSFPKNSLKQDSNSNSNSFPFKNLCRKG
jgi:hypothetical protein